MSSRRQDLPSRRPTGSRPLQKRLFSFDSDKSSIKSARAPSGGSTQEPINEEAQQHVRIPSKASTLQLLMQSDSKEDPFTDGRKWTEEPLVESPIPLSAGESDQVALPPPASSPGIQKGSFSPKLISSLKSSTGHKSHKSQTGERSDSVPTRTPSKVRWEQLRQHVVPAVAPRPSSPSPSVIQTSVSSPARPQTPKPSRLARLGFRHVVEHVREAAIDDSRRFSDDIFRVCWSARAPEAPRVPRHEREATIGTIGSTLYLPFMSTSTLPPSAASSTTTFAQTSQKPHEPRRPQSMASLRQTTSPVVSLHDVILRYASRNPSYLPHESLVLSTLLIPFLTDEAGSSVDEDRWLAVETFEVAVKTWRPASYELDVGRCLWCCNAASTSPVNQNRILGVLASLLCPRAGPFEFRSHHVFLSLVQALFTVLISIRQLTSQNSELTIVTDLISQIRAGSCGSLAAYFADEEIDGTPVAVSGFDESEVRDALVAEAVVRCMENSPDSISRWILHQILEGFWSSTEPSSVSPLLASIQTRKMVAFAHASARLLSATFADRAGRSEDAHMILRILNTRMVTEVSFIVGKRAADARRTVIRLALELLSATDVHDVQASAADAITQLYRSDTQWQSAFEKTIQTLISDSTWPEILTTLQICFKQLTEDVRKPIFASASASLNDRLVADSPPYPCAPLSDLLNEVSQMYPQLFYKPLFACAASTKDLSVVNHLEVLMSISTFLPDFWTRDPEMMLVALMKDVGKSTGGEDGLAWGKARLGQTALLLELIARVRSLPRPDQDVPHNENSTLIAAARFFSVLEMRLGVMIEAKERTSLIPQSHRVLFIVLFKEIRMLIKLLKRSPWCGSTVSWLLQSHVGAVAEAGGMNLAVDEDAIEEVTEHLAKLNAVYIAAQEDHHASHQRRSTMFLFSSSTDNGDSAERNTGATALYATRTQIIATLPRSVTPCALELLVIISASLTIDDYQRLGPFLWTHCLGSAIAEATNSACFLIMHCVEKSPSVILNVVKSDLCSEDDHVKLNAVQRLSLLINLRYQVLSQAYLLDRNRRRPFRFARDPLPFVATDVGSSLYVREEEDEDDVKGSMPLELRRRLSEVGWMEDKKPADQKREWVQTPLQLLPSHQNDRFSSGVERFASSPSASPTSTPTKPRSNSDAPEPTLFRRSSDPTSRGLRRRAVFAPSLAALFPHMATLVFDPHFAVASSARECVLDLMRNDPALLIRPIFDLLANDDLGPAFTAMRAMLHIRATLPPATTHYSFNHLTGYLKLVARESTTSDPLRGFGHAATILSKLVTQVSEMSIREIRRAKVEIFLIPSGSLWFPSSAPAGPMFPRTFQPSRNPFEFSPSLISMTMIRLSQNMLFLAMLKRHPHDVQLIRKSMSRLVLPSLDPHTDHRALDVTDFIPRKLSAQDGGSSPDATLVALSLTLSRSYLLLVAQIFRSMSRHLSDRSELAVFIDGLNRILLAHGNDIGIVSQAMIALMVASTRFRRLFTSGGGYPLFMPMVAKVYSEQEHHLGIRHAIEYATNRFYALHQEVFLFQTLEVVAHVIQSCGSDADWIARNVYDLLSSLHKTASQLGADAAGIRNSNRTQEREALLITTAEEKPQTFLASIRRNGSHDKEQVVIDLPDEYETKPLDIENLVRLLLTVIAHDPTILRAEHFLRFLHLLTPFFYDASKTARAVLRDGIDALGVIIMRAVAKSKHSDTSSASPVDANLGSSSEESYVVNQLHNKSKTPSDVMAMRLEYLWLVCAFLRTGGQLNTSTPQKIFDVVKLLLREAAHSSGQVANFLAEYTELSLVKSNHPNIKEALALLGNLAPIMSAYASAVNFAGVYKAISHLCEDPAYVNDLSFTSLIVTQICRTGLEAYELKSSEGNPSPPSDNAPLVDLLAHAALFRGADIIAEIENRSPSYRFLTGIVFPFVLILNTASTALSGGQQSDAWHRNARAGAWMRLLSYTMTASQKRSQSRPSSSSPERSKSQGKRRSGSSKEHMMTLVASLQVLKIIIIRAEDELSTSLPGIWSRIGAFLKSLLAEGDARFALSPQDQSAPPSPVHSPRTSTTSFDPFDLHDSPFAASASFAIHPSSTTFSNPRVVDYSLWSLLELFCLCRNPLMIQLRVLMQEKVLLLDEDIRAHQSGPSRPRSRRASSSMFTKPRRRLSSVHSGMSSIPSSPLLGVSQSVAAELSLQPLDLNPRTPGFQGSPTSSPSGPVPRIVHLGPVHPSSMINFTDRRSMSPSGGIGSGVRQLTKSATVKSPSLVRATYRRIRLVQTCMGYDLLLPMPSNSGDEETFNGMKAWTKREAIEAVIQETKELSEEFADTWREVEDDVVVIDPDESVTF